MISVVILTHNPKPAIFNEVLQALKIQDFPCANWELIIVDNASDIPVANQFDFSWHPNCKVVIEESLGVVNARRKTIEVATGDWYLFVDDDNILTTNYISTALKIINERPYLGCFGGNQIGKYYEKEPIPQVLKYLEMIAIRNISSNRISNMYTWDTTPASAGSLIRADVVRQFVHLLNTNEVRFSLGRRGNSLMSSEDIDMAYVSIDMGYMNGLFVDLVLHHCIPASRVDPAYLIRLKYYNVYSSITLDYIRFKRIPKLSSFLMFFIRQLYLLSKGNLIDVKMNFNERKAISAVLKDILENKYN